MPSLPTALLSLTFYLTTLASPSPHTFHFPTSPNHTFTPGSVIPANAHTFPALLGTGMSTSLLNLGPCAMLPPHSHPRATNIVVAISGNTTSWTVVENGAGVREVALVPWTVAVFERGSLHGMINYGCENAQLISALNSEDPGTLNHINALFLFPPDIVEAAFGAQRSASDGFDVRTLGRDVPGVGTGAVMGSRECMRRCGIGGLG
ncbi:RmlC-like cupin [Aaosphaeria arxii CBS 175.79]|uniref:RmlC-like cupin n=1 Tax=Aaosphaeria arxii CBS 175.79 TaxID=1450172 RepID=A0A6A5XGV6_9PLEO|nr:RmlC-like cupin [Aaosphaeria arxii CBS 175.79]KAF2012322.1 RmlC-like cupin [Aaosphaeria arxii CBS 175.79]